MRKFTLITALSLTAWPVLADDAALLMGVSRYDELRRVGDGTDILNAADDLRDAGYSVSTLSNGSAQDMNRLLEEFADEATDADRLVAGLAGRFVTDGTRTWFLAEDTDRPSLFGLGAAVSVDTVMQVLSSTPGQAVLVLGFEAGSDDTLGPYLREGVGDLQVPQGVTVIYGEPGTTDAVLSDALAKPGGNIMAFVRDTRRLTAVGYQPQSLIMQPAGTPDEQPFRAPEVTDPTLPAWNAAQQADTADSYRDFLFANPRSPYAAEARRRLNDIENDPVRLAENTENALNLTRNERRAIQRNLTLLDFNTRGVDGIFGPGTRGAIRNWQQNNGFAQTSYLTAEQINRIDAQASRRAAEIETEEERARQEALQRDRAFWEETGARGDAAGYRAYLERYPDGTFAPEARAGLEELNVDTGAQERDAARAQEDALSINPVLRRLIESRLAGLGFEPGPIDGRFDDRTRRAIANYQNQRNLTASGFFDQQTLARLLADTF